jgi:signal transduction histidine kinase
MQIAALKASRKRLLVATAAERRRIERDLHQGVQQHLVAFSVNLQLARELVDAEPAAAKTLLAEIARDVQQALDEAGQLAQRIYPPLDEVSLATTLRSAAVRAGVRASVDVVARERYPSEIAAALYWSWLDVLEQVGDGASVALQLRDDDAFAFELVADSDQLEAALERLRDRVEALGGQVRIHVEPGPRTRVNGSVPSSA